MCALQRRWTRARAREGGAWSPGRWRPQQGSQCSEPHVRSSPWDLWRSVVRGAVRQSRRPRKPAPGPDPTLRGLLPPGPHAHPQGLSHPASDSSVQGQRPVPHRPCFGGSCWNKPHTLSCHPRWLACDSDSGHGECVVPKAQTSYCWALCRKRCWCQAGLTPASAHVGSVHMVDLLRSVCVLAEVRGVQVLPHQGRGRGRGAGGGPGGCSASGGRRSWTAREGPAVLPHSTWGTSRHVAMATTRVPVAGWQAAKYCFII